ncbi:MAG: hypothetical protein AAB819_01270 [Patescibacteria group bacterium]
MKSHTSLSRVFAIVLIIGAFLAPQVSSAVTVEELQAQINSLLATIASLQKQLGIAETAPPPKECYTFVNTMRIGASNPDVSHLHIFLEKEGFAVDATEKSSFTFGEGTASAVSGFQEKYRDDVLTPLNLKYGTGFFGKATMNKLNTLYGCGIGVPAPRPIPVPTPWPPVSPTPPLPVFDPATAVCAQPPMPPCRSGFMCIQVMPTPTTYANEELAKKAGAEILYKGMCRPPVNIPPPPTITVLSPNGGETWQIGQSKKISWSMENIPSTAVLYLSLVSGPTPIDLESVNPIGSTNSVDLVLPSGGCFGDVCYPGGILPGNYKISATVYDKPNPGFAISVVPDSSYTQPKIIASDVSDVSFSVVAAVGTKTAPTMTLTANPMTVNSGQSTQLSWTSTNATSCVPTSNIGYWGVSVGGSTTGPIYTTTTFTVVCSSPGGSTSKSVTVTVTSTPSITVLSPNGGETWTLGTTRTITWSSNNIPSNHFITNIELVNSSGGRYSVLDNTPNDGSESAFLPFFIPQGIYWLEIMTALNGQAIIDKSDGPITVIGAISTASAQSVSQMASALEAGRQALLGLLKLLNR